MASSPTGRPTLDELDLALQPELDARKVRDLAVRAKANVAILGTPEPERP